MLNKVTLEVKLLYKYNNSQRRIGFVVWSYMEFISINTEVTWYAFHAV
jgi:hypothetical protein